MSDTISEPALIEGQLDNTRSRLNTHLSQLQEKLSPGNLVDDLVGYFRGSDGAIFNNNLMANIRGNPIPVALTGIGLVWLMASSTRGTQGTGEGLSQIRYPGRPDDTQGSRLRQAEGNIVRSSGEDDQHYQERLDSARGQALGLSRSAEESAPDFASRVRGALGTAQQKLTETAHDLGDQAGAAIGAATESAQGLIQNVGERASDTWYQTRQTVSEAAGSGGRKLIETLSENPVLLGVLGAAAGALLGALMPQSDQEEAALGDIAGQARQTAKRMTEEGIDRGKQVVQAVTDKARESAESHGLIGGDQSPGQLVDAALSGDLSGSVKDVATDVLSTGHDAASKGIEALGDKLKPPAD